LARAGASARFWTMLNPPSPFPEGKGEV